MELFPKHARQLIVTEIVSFQEKGSVETATVHFVLTAIHLMTPRDPKRIDRMIERLREAWHHNPDMRLTQLLINASDTPYDCDEPHKCGLGLVYYIEDDEMEKKLRGWARPRRILPSDENNTA